MVIVCVSEFQRVYDCLDIKIIERGESYYQDMMTKVVKEFDDKGQCAAGQRSRGLLRPFLRRIVNSSTSVALNILKHFYANNTEKILNNCSLLFPDVTTRGQCYLINSLFQILTVPSCFFWVV